MNLEEILSKLEIHDYKIFQRDALQQAVKQQQEITPALLEIIERIAKDPHWLDENPSYMGYMYALYLLAQFREKKAYPIIVEYFSQLGVDNDMDAMGDIVTEDLGSILASVCGNDLGLIKQMIENPEINEFVRSASITALVVLYKKDQLTRQALVSYLQDLMDEKLEQDGSFVWAAIACSAYDIYPGELYDQLINCFDQGLIDESMTNKSDLESYMNKGEEKILKKLKEDKRYDFINDVISQLEWWACFQPDPPKRNHIEQPSFIENNYIKRDELPYIRDEKVGRNEPCPCGSGKKYKKCCLH